MSLPATAASGTGRWQSRGLPPPGPLAVPRRPVIAPGPWLTTASILRGRWEVRLARIDPDTAPAHWTLRIGGWPVADEKPPHHQEGPGAASVRTAEGLTSSITALLGTMLPGIHRPPGAHAFGQHTAIPYLRSATPALPGEIYAVIVTLSADPTAQDEPPQLTIETTEANEPAVTVTWPNGEHDQLTL